jgi:hypothetical protein
MRERVQLSHDPATNEPTLRVARVQIVEGRMGLESGIGAQVFFTDAHRSRVMVKGEVLPDESGPIREPPGKGTRGRHQKQLRSPDRPAGYDRMLRANLVGSPHFVEIARTGHSALRVERKFIDHRIGPQVELARRRGARKRNRERRPLGMDRASVGTTGPTVHTTRPTSIGSRVDPHRYAKRVVAQLSRTLREVPGRYPFGMWRIGKRRLLWGTEGIGRVVPRHAEVALGLLIEGLEIRIRNRPVRKTRTLDRALLREDFEIIGLEAP